MLSKKLYLDANILLDLLLDRDKKVLAKKYIVNNQGNLHISALTAHLVMHFGLKILGQNVLKKYLDDFYIEDLTAQDVEWAFNNSRDNDFEDALQIAIAIRCGCDVFATFDKNLYKTYQNLPSIKLLYLA